MSAAQRPGRRELVVALRSFLHYLHVAGLISAPLQWAVPLLRISVIGRCRAALSRRW